MNAKKPGEPFFWTNPAADLPMAATDLAPRHGGMARRKAPRGREDFFLHLPSCEDPSVSMRLALIEDVYPSLSDPHGQQPDRSDVRPGTSVEFRRMCQ